MPHLNRCLPRFCQIPLASLILIAATMAVTVGCGDAPESGRSVTEAPPSSPVAADPLDENVPLDPEFAPVTTGAEAAAVSSQVEQREFLSRVFGSLYDRVSANGLQQLPEHTRDLYVVQYFRREFELGGLEYYFYNTASDHAFETVDALRAMNAPETADILQQAFDVFPQGRPSREVTKRQDVLDDLTTDQQELLTRLDQQLATLVAHLPSRETDFIHTRGIKFEFRN